jgi:hypothetical protein
MALHKQETHQGGERKKEWDCTGGDAEWSSLPERQKKRHRGVLVPVLEPEWWQQQQQQVDQNGMWGNGTSTIVWRKQIKGTATEDNEAVQLIR